MRILFLLVDFPDPRVHTNLYTDLAIQCVRQGHEVYVVTHMEQREGRDTFMEEIEGIRALRVRCGNWYGVGPVRKAITTLTMTQRFLDAIDSHLAGLTFDLVLYPTPPVTFAGVVRELRHRSQCRTYLILRDIFPQNARDLGIIRDPLTFAFFRRKERHLYALSDHIGCMSQGNVEYLLAHNDIPREKLEVLPNWEHVLPLPQMDVEQTRREFGLPDGFIAVFGGNMGPAQDMGFLLELAALYRDRDDVQFLLMGWGSEVSRVRDEIQRRGMRNVIVRDMLNRVDYMRLLRCCDIGLINLDRRFTIPNIPSKTLSYFAAGLPVLASIDASTDYGRLLDECGAGLWSITGDLPAYRANFERLLHDSELRRRLGINGRKALEQRFTVERAYQVIMRHFPAGSEVSRQVATPSTN